MMPSIEKNFSFRVPQIHLSSEYLNIFYCTGRNIIVFVEVCIRYVNQGKYTYTFTFNNFLSEVMKVRYFDIAWLSKVDGPGNRVVLFLQGCHLRCPWCHSPHSWESHSPILFNQSRCMNCNNCVEICEKGVHIIADGVHKLERKNCIKCGKCIEACPTSKTGHNTGALSLPTQHLDASKVFDILLPQLEVVKEYGGLTISGGEALLQKEAVLEILHYCKAHGIHTAIETSLTLPTEVYSYVSGFVDCWLIGMRDVSYNGSTKNLDGLVLSNASYISSLGREVVVRFPIIKGYTDSMSQLERLSGLMDMGKFKDIELLPCNRDLPHYYGLCGMKPQLSVDTVVPNEDEIIGIVSFFTRAGFNVSVIRQGKKFIKEETHEYF